MKRGLRSCKTAIAILGVLAFMLALGRAPIATSHEARVAATALTMVDSGMPWSARPVEAAARTSATAAPGLREVNPWVVPVYEGRLRLEKPPLPYWCTAATYLLLGPSETSARLVTALMGLLATALVWRLARELCGRRTAFWAAVFWVSTFFVVDEYRKVMPDPYLAFFTLLGIVAWLRLCRREAGGWAPAIGFYLVVAMGLLSKGPVLLLHVAIPIVLLGLLYRRWPKVRLGAHLLGAVVVLLVTVPWFAYLLLHIPNLLDLWRYESVGEFADNRINARAWFFYIGSMLQVTLPWTPLFVAGVVIALKRRRRALLFPLLWCALVVLFFSLAFVKKNAYLLPLMPACALLVGRALALALAWMRRRLANPWPAHLVNVQHLVGMGMGVAVAVMLMLGPPSSLKHVHGLKAMLQVAAGRWPLEGTLALLALLAALIPPLLWRRRSLGERMWAQACGYAVITSLWVGYVESEKSIRRGSDLDFAAHAAAAQHAPTSPVPPTR